jgi:hypothetical protein
VQSVPDRLAGVTLLRQSEYRAIAERLAWETPRVASFSQFLLRDDKPVEGVPAISRYPGFETGLRTHDGVEKPSFAGFRLPVAALREGGRTSLFGLVRGAAAGTEVQLLANDGAGPPPAAHGAHGRPRGLARDDGVQARPPLQRPGRPRRRDDRQRASRAYVRR